MAKKMKRKTLVGLLVVSSIVAVGGVLGLVEGTSGGISKMFEEKNVAEAKYIYVNNLVEEYTDDSTLTQKIDLSDDATSPFKKVVYNLNLYGDEDGGILPEDDTSAYVKNCSKLEIRFTLKDDVDFYVSNLEMTSQYATEDLSFLESFDEGLHFSVRAGYREFVTYDNQSKIYAMSQNAYSKDIVVTITNDKAKEKEDSIFLIPNIIFNYSEATTWTAN